MQWKLRFKLLKGAFKLCIQAASERIRRSTQPAAPRRLHVALEPDMKPFALLLVLIATAGELLACSFSTSPVFEPRGKLVESARGLPKLVLVSYNFVPRISGAESCDGTGFISIRLRARDNGTSLRKFGFRLGKVTEKTNAVIPTELLSADSVKNGVATVSWAWTWAESDPDGHFRWEFTIQPVSKNGSVGEALEVCVSSKGSCDES